MILVGPFQPRIFCDSVIIRFLRVLFVFIRL